MVEGSEIKNETSYRSWTQSLRDPKNVFFLVLSSYHYFCNYLLIETTYKMEHDFIASFL